MLLAKGPTLITALPSLHDDACVQASEESEAAALKQYQAMGIQPKPGVSRLMVTKQ
jgi:hypothetical protein